MTNIFKKTYRVTTAAEKAYRSATSRAEKDEAERAYNKAVEKITSKGNIVARIWHEYEESMDCENEHLDISYTVWDKDVKALINTLRENGIKTFTFSANWSGAIETAWLFEQNGCKMRGLVEINSRDKYKKAHALLFRIQPLE